MKSTIQNENKAQIVRTEYTMQAVVLLPLVGRVHSPKGIAASAEAAGQDGILRNRQPCPCSR